MDVILILKALLMGMVEGVTEFLPISSTGHLIIAGELLDFMDKQRRDVFEISIQLGAILAVCWEYRTRLINVAVGLPRDPKAQQFVINLAIAFLPAAIIGLIMIKTIKKYLFYPVPVATALIIGGLVIIWAERRAHNVRIAEVDDMKPIDALKIGMVQCLAMIPGTSRSGATIIGGLFLGLSRKAATEFSFFLAIPTMFAATFYEVYKHRDLFNADDFIILAVGFGAAFTSAFLTVRGLIRFVSKHNFTPFAYYRILFGGALILLTWSGLVNWSA